MTNELTTTNGQVTLLDARSDEKRFPRLHTYTREQAVQKMATIVTKAFLYRGQTAESNNIHFISSTLVEELIADNDRIGSRYITFFEIDRAVKKAVLSTEMYTISVASLYKIISEYIKGEGHRLSQEVRKRREQRELEEMKRASTAPMLQSYAGALLKNTKK